jgi:DNA-binding NarL/FixJ family response regulator
MSSAIRVGLLDDHAVVRSGYRRLIELEPDLVVHGEYASAEAAYADLTRDDVCPVELLVVDISLPGMSGLELVRRLTRRLPGLRTLVFSMHESPATVRSCLSAGARGFITKNSAPEAMVEALRRVAGGELIVSDDIADLGVAPRLQAELSTREFDILQRLVVGQSLEQIAATLHLSGKTVANYQSELRRKLGAASAIELMHHARRMGLTSSFLGPFD